MKKIMMISNMYPSERYPSYGVFVKNFEEMASDLNFDVDKVVLYKETKKIKKLISYLIYYIKIIIKIIFGKYDAVYVHYAAHNALPIIIASYFKKIKLFTNVHGSDVIPEKPSQYKFQPKVRKLLGISEFVVCPSQYFKDVVANKFNVDRDKILIFPSGGVNEKLFLKATSKDIQGYKEKYKIPSNKKIIGYVGRIDTKKGWDVLLKAINKLNKENYMDDKVVIIVGNGQEINDFNKMINEYNIGHLVHHFDLLPQKQLPEIYAMLDVFCFPTMREGESLGLVALEAMACGVPVIGSDFAALKDYIFNNINGYKFEMGNDEELVIRIKEYFSLSDEEIISLREGASKTSEEYYSCNLSSKLSEILMKI